MHHLVSDQFKQTMVFVLKKFDGDNFFLVRKLSVFKY